MPRLKSLIQATNFCSYPVVSYPVSSPHMYYEAKTNTEEPVKEFI